jgi:hypothetical protein
MKKLKAPLVAIFIATVTILFFALNSCKKELYGPTAKTKSGVDAPITEDTTTVMTPFGRRLKSEVVLIEPGYHLSYNKDGHIQKIETATGKMIRDFGMPKRPAIAEANLNTNTNDKSVHDAVFPTDTVKNWTVWAKAVTYKQGPTFQAFSTTWKVPNLPTTPNDGQVIYIFDGIHENDSTGLLQPVLQYGFDGTAGGNYWSVQNYFVPGCVGCAPMFHGTNIQVSPGTTLTGAMTKSGSAGSYAYTSSFGSAYSSNDLSVTNYPNINAEYGVETLETYHITQSSDYPPDTAVRMTSITAGATNIVTSWNLFRIR